ncbi:autotransporter outer membrane beta-barrel domain-containing protein [Exilibacterium tricleocarpae]|nr:autotransporter outer membrane beta-barrel domain-containing protein [Exilibacterium tricleocarpae]
MRILPDRFLGCLGVVSLLGAASPGFADLADLAGDFQTELEELAAVTNQQVYENLLAQGCEDTQREADSEGCGGQTFVLFTNVRELVHTANEILGSGPTQFSLGVNLEELGFALRWTAAEEFAAQGSLSSGFVNGQLSGLAGRITALRRGARGFVVNFNGAEDVLVAGSAQRLGAGASADDGAGLNDRWSQWGGFLNGSFLYGEKAPTELENAFDFDGQDINGGIDYRISAHWVAGAVFGYQEQEVDFDSRRSIVDGGITMEGFSIMPFVLYQSDRWYFSGSAGYQSLEFDTERSIRYPSLNPDSESVDTLAVSTADAEVFSMYATAGYSWRLHEQLRLEPYLSLEYQDITVDKYRERDIFNDGFDFIVPEQNIDSFETVLGAKAQFLFSNTWGVLNPYLDLQWRHQMEDDARNIRALYASADGLGDAESFVIPTDVPDSEYYMYTLGLAAVLRGAAEGGGGGPAAGGIQAFLNWRFIDGLDNYEQDVIALGVRYEF